jgi:pimeloyl-ACP methyl ester carboxylesterase
VQQQVADPPLHGYNLGLMQVTQRDLPGVPETMPVPLTGAIGFPPGGQAVPLVVILHGRHRGCHFALPQVSQWPCPANTETRFDLGFSYLAESLIKAGFGVLIPNLNAAFSETYGAGVDTRNQLADQRSQQILDAHLTRLAIAAGSGSNAFGLALANRIDWTKLALVGHSMGGGAAARNALVRVSHSSPEAVAGGLGPVSALVLVSPTRSYPLPQAEAVYQLADIPTAILLGSCDRDLLDYSSLYYFELANQAASRQSFLTTVLLLGANHNFFNAAVEQDDYYRRADSNRLCNPQQSNQRLSRVTQEQFLQDYLPKFLEVVLDPDYPEDSWADLAMAPGRAAPDRLYDRPVLTNLVVPSSRRHWVFRAGVGGASYQASPGLSLTTCLQFRECGGAWRSPPSLPFYALAGGSQPPP